MNKKEDIIMIDCELLAQALAEEAFKEEVTKAGIPNEDLYEVIGQEEVHYGVVSEMVEITQVRSRWAYLFFMLKDRYKELVEQYKK